MPGSARAAPFFNSPKVLVKHDTPQKFPTYFPIPMSGIKVLRSIVVLLFGIYSLKIGFNELELLNLNAVTFPGSLQDCEIRFG